MVEVERDRTDDPLLAKQVLSQLSYTPNVSNVVGLDGFEPSTPALSRRCSNQLSYRPSDGKPEGQELQPNRTMRSALSFTLAEQPISVDAWL